MRLGSVSGDTRRGTRLASRYGLPSRPGQLGLPPRYPGREQVLSFHVPSGARNAGVRVVERRRRAADPARAATRTGSRASTALDLVENPYLDRYGDRTPVSGLLLPRAGRYYISVETRPGSQPGPYRLRVWADDTSPPTVRIGSRILYGTDPELHLVVRDRQSGFDPASLSVTVDGRQTGHVSIAGPNVSVELGRLSPGRHRVRISAADYQELKNSENADQRPLPNTRLVRASITVR